MSVSFCAPRSIALVERIVKDVLYLILSRLQLDFLQRLLELRTHHDLSVLLKLLCIIERSLHEMINIDVF
jgi:hypothetical protein